MPDLIPCRTESEARSHLKRQCEQRGVDFARVCEYRDPAKALKPPDQGGAVIRSLLIDWYLKENDDMHNVIAHWNGNMLEFHGLLKES